MAARSQITVLLVGDSSGAQKAFKDAAAAANAAAAQTDSAATTIAGAGEKIGASGKHVESFGSAFAGEFLKLGAAAAVGAKAAEAVIEGVHAAGEAVVEYTTKMQASQSTILAVTHSHDALASALAFANEQAKAGRAPYSDVVAAIAELTPTAKRANLDVQDLYHTVQLLSALNSGPEGGVQGATVAINNALTGQFTSLQDRFNLNTTGIQKAIAAGVPPLVAINDALAKEGVTMDLVNAKTGTLANQTAILKDNVTRLIAEKTEGFFTGAAEAARGLNDQITNQGSLLHALIDDFKGLDDALKNFGTSGFGTGLQQELNANYLAITEFFHNIPNTRSADDPFEKMLQEHIANYKRVLDGGAPQVADAAAKLPAAAVSGAQPTAAQTAAVQGYGSALLGAYLRGLDPAGRTLFGDLQQIVNDSLKAAAPDGKVDDSKLRTILPLIAQLSDEVARTGTVSAETWAKVQAALGGEAPEIRTLIADYQALTVAKEAVAAATAKVASAEATQREDSKAAAGEAAGWATQIKTARDNQAAADKAEAANIKGLTDTRTQLAQGQQASAQAGAEAVRLLGVAEKEAAEAGAAALVPLNAELKATQAAGQAVADGYKRQNDEIQRQIDLNNDLVGALEHQRDVKFLAIDERLAEIGKSRDANDRREAATLRRERAQVERDSKGPIDLERERAQVANYGLQQQQKGIQDAAKAQADANATAVANIQARIDKQTEANTTTQANFQKQIDDQTEANRLAALGWQQRLDAQQTLIDAATAAAANRHNEDQDRIDMLQTLADNSAKYWADRATADGQAVTDAQAVETAAKGTQAAAEGTLAAWQATIKSLADAGLLGPRPAGSLEAGEASSAPGDTPIRATGPTAVGGARDAREDGTGASGAPSGGGRTGVPGGATTDGLPLLATTSASNPPGGYHAEFDDRYVPWYVPNGHTLTDYGKTPAHGAGATPSTGGAGASGADAAQAVAGAGFGTPQTVNINAYGVGEAELLNRMTAAIQRVGAA